MLVDATLLTKEEIQNEADKRTTLALVIGEGESKRQRNLMSVKEQTWHTRDLTSHLYWEDGNKAVRNIRKG
jgi:hypothetical protein